MDILSLIDYVRNWNEGKKLAEVSSDIALANGDPENLNFIKQTLPSYGMVNPNVVTRANADLENELTRYKAQRTADLENKAIAGVREFGNLYPDWRREVGNAAPDSQFYSDYAGRIDPGVAVLEPYQKGIKVFTEGTPEGYKRSSDMANDAAKRTASNQLGSYIANTPLDSNLASWNKFVEGMYNIPNVDLSEVRQYAKDAQGRNSGISGRTNTTTAQVGPETSKHTVQLDIFGNPIAGTGATATDNPAGRAIAQAQLSIAKKPDVKFLEVDIDGQPKIMGFNIQDPKQAAQYLANINNGYGTPHDPLATIATTEYDEDGVPIRKVTEKASKARPRTQGKAKTADKRTVTRTGTLNGKKVIQYSDGTVEYAN